MMHTRMLIALTLLAAAATAQPPPECSIREFAACSTDVDQRDGVAAAFAAAQANTCTLVVDCALLISIGLDIAKPIFVESGTHVVFRGGGQFLVANTLLPAFLFINVHDIELLGWDILYVGSQWYKLLNGTYSIDQKLGYYVENGTVVLNDGNAPVGGSFNDGTLRTYYAQHRNVTGANPLWSGPNDIAGLFNIMGSTRDVRVDGMRLNASGANAVDFLLNSFAFNIGFQSDQSVTPTTPLNNSTAAIPSNITFTNVVLDRTYFGWVGSARGVTIANVTSYRYSDLQDPVGTALSMGGCFPENTTACWFPPPHLFYFNFGDPATTDPALWNVNISITDVVDHGIRVGPNHRILTSGNCLSLKIGAVNASVQRYYSGRVDGAVDVVYAEGLHITDMVAEYDSSFLDNAWPAWRFTRDEYRDIAFVNVVTTDRAAVNAYPPFWGDADPNNTAMFFSNFTLVVNNLWQGITTNVTGQLPGSLRTYRDALTGAEMTIDAENVVRNVSASVH